MVLSFIRRKRGEVIQAEHVNELQIAAEQLDADKADTTALDAYLPIADVLNEPDMATGATDKPPSQASVVAYVEDELEAGLATKLDDTVSPTLLMSPDLTRDRRGALSPTIAGTVTTVAGQYGDAWSLDSADAAITVPQANIWDPDVGTVFVRALLTGAPALNPYSFNVGGTAPNRFYMGVSNTGQPRVAIGSTIFSQTLTGFNPQTWHVHAARYDRGTMRQFINGQGLPAQNYTGDAAGTTPLRINIPVAGSTPYDVEAVLIFHDALPDSEIERISTLMEAWTWQNVRLRFPETVDVADDLAAHVADTDNPHGVTADDVGLGNVDNTSDADKPISTAQQSALNTLAQLAGNTGTAVTLLQAVLAAQADVMAEVGALFGPDAVRYEGDVLWVGPAGPQWHNWEDIQAGVWSNERFNHGTWGTGPMPGEE